AQTVHSNNYHHLTLSGSGTKTLQTGTTSIAGDLTLSGTAAATGVIGLTISGTAALGAGTSFTAGSYTHNVAGDWTNNGGTFTGTGSTVNFNGSAGQTIGGSATTTFNNVTTANTANAATGIATNIGGTLSIGDGSTFTAAGYDLTVTGTTTVGGGTSGSLVVSSAAGTKTFAGLVTVASGATWNNSGNSAVTFQGGITNNNTFTAGSGVHTFDTNAQALTGTFSISNVTVTGVTLTNNNALTVGAALSGTGGLTQAANATLNIGGTSGITTMTATNSGNTANYTGAAQTVHSNNYHHLTLSGSGTKTLQTGTTSIAGDLTLSGTAAATLVISLTVSGQSTVNTGTTLNLGSSGYVFTLTGSGTGTSRPLYMNGGILNEGANSTVKFTGTSDSSIEDETYYHLELAPSGGTTPTYTLATAGSQTITTQNLTIGNGTNGVSVTAATNNPILDINGDLLINNSGTFTGGTQNITVGTDGTTDGDFTIESGGTWAAGSGTLILDGGSAGLPTVFWDKNDPGSRQDMGELQIGASPAATDLSSDLKANSLTISAGDILNTNGYDLDIGNGGIEVNGTLDCTDDVETDETYINTAEDFNVNSGATLVQDQSTVEFDDLSGTNTLITNGSFSLYNLVINGGASIIIQVQDPLDVDNDVTITSGALDVVDTENNQITVGGSWSNADEFTARSGLVLFDSGDTEETIDSGGTGALKDFYDIQFNNSAGGWTIQTNNLTATHNFTITDTAASGFTVNSVTVEVNGTYNCANAEFSNTTWTSATLYLNGTSQTIGSKTQAEETYSTLHVGTDDDIRMWQSSASLYTIDSGASLYSMDHDANNGELDIWGDYHTNGTDYWNYNDDFDSADISGSPRDCAVKLASSASVTIDAGETLEAVGVSGHVTVVDWQSSGGYNIVNYTGSPGGTIDFQYASFDHLKGNKGIDIQSGSAVTSLNYTDFDNLVDSDATDAYIYVDTTVIGSVTKTITGANFGNTGGANFNVNRSDAEDTGYWDFDAHTGALAGESYDGKNDANEADPGMLKWDDSVAGITVDGIIYTNEGGSPYLCSTTGNLTVDVRVNGAGSYTAECTQDTGAFSVTGVPIGSASDVVAIFVNEDGVGSVYATAVTKAADTTSGITANLYQDHVIIRHEDGGPMTIDNLDYFDSGNDTDIQFTADNGTPDLLTVNDGHELYIWAGDNFTPGGNVTVDDIEILGIYTATGSEAITVSGSWVNSGTFTAASSTATFDATSGTEAINSTGATTDDFNDLVLGSGSGTATWNLGSVLDVDGDLTIDYGTLGQGTNNIALEGILAINAGGDFSSGSGTFTFDGSTSPVTWSNTATIDDLGAVTIDGAAKTVNLNSSVQATSVTVGADDVLGLGDSGHVLTISGSGTAGSRPFIVNNASGLAEGTNSTVKFTGTTATEIEEETYYHLELAPSGGAGPTFTLGTAVSQTLAVSGNLTVGNGVNSVTVTGDTHHPTLNVSGDVAISTNGTLTASGTGTFTVGGSWANSGTFTPSGATVTFNSTDAGETISDGGSAFHNILFNGTNGEWLYQDGASTALNQTTVQDGTATFLNVKTDTLSVTAGGTFNQDWYLGTHVTDAANTSTDVDTGDNDITFSEAGSNATVWKHSGANWGSAAASQTTGTTAVNGDNPQPNDPGAIRIREFSMTDHTNCPGVGCTIYRYNEQITWVDSYGEYDYYDDHGENYLTSCRAGSTTACSDDSTDDDEIGVVWYRSTIGTMNTPLSTVNEPPTNGSWHAGMLEAISFSIDTFSRDFGVLTPGANPTDLTNTLTVTTSASHGYVIYARAEQDMTCSNAALCGTAAISDWGGSNEIPTTWSGGSFGFGYSTNDYDLQEGEGAVDRFSGSKFAGFIETGFGDPVADRTGSSSAQANIITYRIAASGIQNSGTYQTSIYYVVAPTY
ncbi:MAG: hypothetical protein U9M90_00635, partial [Patescibacteria group bacterium]|nr:hypothetical protein [Patescibacteria group bacterium]